MQPVLIGYEVVFDTRIDAYLVEVFEMTLYFVELDRKILETKS